MAGVQNNAGLFSAMRRLERYKSLAGAFIAILIFIIGVVVLHRLASEISWRMVKTDISGLAWSALALSVLCTVVSYTGWIQQIAATL